MKQNHFEPHAVEVRLVVERVEYQLGWGEEQLQDVGYIESGVDAEQDLWVDVRYALRAK